MFYHLLKAYMSPSALATYVSSKVAFAQSYFEVAKRVKTMYMDTGNVIHELLANGFMPAKKRYDVHEQDITVSIEGTNFMFMGRPDSRRTDGTEFVDYKSGVANDWKDELASDVKMRATAFLIWKHCGKPQYVKGYIEFIPTTYNEQTKQLEPIEEIEHDIIPYEYTYDELAEFETYIAKKMHEINEFHERWIRGSAEFINEEDIAEYKKLNDRVQKLDQERSALIEQQNEIKTRIQDQMAFGGLMIHKTDFGNFYYNEKPEYHIPDNLPIKVGRKKMEYWETQEIANATSAALKNYKVGADPSSVTRTVTFKPRKQKR